MSSLPRIKRAKKALEREGRKKTSRTPKIEPGNPALMYLAFQIGKAGLRRTPRPSYGLLVCMSFWRFLRGVQGRAQDVAKDSQ
jgi:hypothetical protein